MNQNLRFLLTAAITSTCLVSTSLLAGPIFTVQESVAGSASNIVTADRISFEYHARIDQTINGGTLAGSNDPFNEDGFLTKAAFGSPTGGSVPSQLNSLGGYGIYGLFNITGESDPNGGGIQATFNTFNMTLFIDPNQDTTLAVPGSGPVVAGGLTADDFPIVNFTLSDGEAHIFNQLANGDFDTLLNMTLTPQGMAFFTSPTPFFPLESLGGNTENFVGGNLTSSFTAFADGGGIELFQNQQVPEPTTLALLGLGIMGMGFISRRRR